MFFGFQHAHWNGHGFAVSESNTIKYAFIPYKLTHIGKKCGEIGTLGGGPEVVNPDQVLCQGKVATGVDRVTGQVVGPGTVTSVKPKHQPSVLLTILTAMFMHGGLLHIAGNMLFLWIFGNNVEDSMARWRFVLFYLLGGIVANFAQIAVGPNSTAPGIGASGAIAAVLGGYALLYPRARVITAVILIFFITLLDLPALLVLGGWFLLQLLDAALHSPVGGCVADFAHIGGFSVGVLLL